MRFALAVLVFMLKFCGPAYARFKLTQAVLLTIVMLMPLRADAQLRIVTYNTAGGPRFAGDVGSDTVLSAIGAEETNGIARPIDILLLQEQNSPNSNTQQFVNLLNSIYGAGTYARGSLVLGSRGGGQPGVIYNTNTVSLLSEQAIGDDGTSSDPPEQPRQGGLYRFRPLGYGSQADFYVFNDHFKAGASSTDKDRRLVEAEAIRSAADDLGESAHVIYVGDYNVRSSSESSVQHLLGPGNGQAFDPIDQLGTWHDNLSFRSVHTQSPSDGTTSGLTGGGIDDRFDFQWTTAEMLDGEGLSYIGTGIGDVVVSEHSYNAFGNNNTHEMNGPVNDPNNTAQPDDVLDALAVVSDHLPVVADYQLPSRMVVAVDPVPARVIVGATSKVDFIVDNTAPVSVAVGADELDYAATGTGAVTGTAAGVDAPLGGGQSYSFALDTTIVGPRGGQIVVTSDSQMVQDGEFMQVVEYDVLQHSEASLSGISNRDVLALDLGTFEANTGQHSYSLNIYNLAGGSPEDTADLQITGLVGEGDSSRLFTDITVSHIAPDSSAAFNAFLDTAVIGDFNAT